MITLVCGTDSFRAKQKLLELLDNVKEQNLAVELFDFDEKDFSYQDFLAEQKNFSLFDPEKVFVFKGVFSNGAGEFAQMFLDNFDSHLKSQDKIIFFDAVSLDSVPKKNGKDLLDALVDKTELFFFEAFNPAMTKNWIEKQVMSLGLEIDPMAKEVLYNFFGNNLWQLDNEIKKLANYCDKKINLPDVKKLCRPNEVLDIFKTIEAIAKKDRVLALNLVYKHLKTGETPIYILAILADSFRKMIAVKELSDKKIDYKSIAKITGYHPFVLSKIYAQSQEFSYDELKRIYNKIFKADFEIKTGRIEAPVSLDLLILAI
jgi:DNA polymerase III delta subunit